MNNFSVNFVPLECVLEYPSDKEIIRKNKSRKNELRRIAKDKKVRKQNSNFHLIEDKYLTNLFKNSYRIVNEGTKLNFSGIELEQLKKMCFNVMLAHIGDLYLGKLDKGKLRTELKIICRKTIKDAYCIKNDIHKDDLSSVIELF